MLRLKRKQETELLKSVYQSKLRPLSRLPPLSPIMRAQIGSTLSLASTLAQQSDEGLFMCFDPVWFPSNDQLTPPQCPHVLCHSVVFFTE